MRYLALASVLCMVGVGMMNKPEAPADAISTQTLADDGWTMEAAPVPGAAARPAAAPASGGFAGGAFVDEQRSTYTVRGSSEAEILASLQDGGPQADGQRFFGLTVSESAFQIQPVSDGQSCVVADARVELTVSIVLPEWDAPGDASYELQRDWTRFLTALTRHEDRHREIAVQSAEATRAALQGLRRPTCDEVEFEARQRAERIATDAETAHHRYDAQTDHGRTQGAQWPLP